MRPWRIVCAAQLVVTGITFVGLLIAASNAGLSLVALLVCLVLVGFLGLVWSVQLVVGAVLVIRLRTSSVPALSWTTLLAPPVAGVLLALIVAADLPFRARFKLSEGALESTARSFVASGARQDTEDRRVGLFRVTRTYVDGSCVRMETYGRFLAWGGLAWCWEPPSTTSEEEYEHIRGDWWHWIERF